MPVLRWLSLIALSVLLLSAYPLAQEPARRDRPAQPPPAACGDLPEDERRKTEGCKTEAERREDDQARRRKEAEARERVTRTSFLRWMHIDSLWAPASTDTSTVGLIGAHVAVANLGRIYFFGPPGVMLLIEDHPEGRRINPALTWGMSVHLTQFHIPGTSRDAQLFLNFAKCWTMGDERTGLDMVGLSVSWKK